MSAPVVPAAGEPVEYPESDGRPMADNTKQFRWIVTLADNLYDPDVNRLQGYVRRGMFLGRVYAMNGFTSPRLGIRFDLSGPELVVRYPDGRPFLTFEELAADRDRER